MAIPVIREKLIRRPFIIKSPKDYKPWMAGEIRGFLSDVALTEAQSQIRYDNPPSRALVDRRGFVDISPSDVQFLKSATLRARIFPMVRYNIRWTFTNLEVLWDAVKYAYMRLRKAMKQNWQSGDSWRSIYFWCSDPTNRGRSTKIENIAQVKRWIQASSSEYVNVRILGPLYEYRRTVVYGKGTGGRKLSQWVSTKKGLTKGPGRDRYTYTGAQKSLLDKNLGKNVSTYAKQVRTRKRGTSFGSKYQVKVGKAIHTAVVADVKRSFKDIRAWYRFVPSRETLPVKDKKWQSTRMEGPNIHIPEIFIGILSPGGPLKGGVAGG